MNPSFRQNVKINNKDFIFELYFDSNFSEIPHKVKQSLGVVLNENSEVLLVSEDNIRWTLPGGTVEPGETLEQTLLREVYEETAVQIDESTIKPFFYNVISEIIDNKEEYAATQVRFFARVERVDKFLGDPGGNMRFRKFVPINELDNHLKWGKTTDWIKKEIKKFLS